MGNSSKLLMSLALVAFAACGGALHAADSQTTSSGYRVGDKLERARAPSAGDFELIEWDALVPKDWDPMKDFQSLNLGILRDGDPRAQEALERLKRAWNNAPTVPAMEGQHVRIAGFVVPLEAQGDKLREFLLVPYFGACIHVPPPPSNQIIHVTLTKPIKGARAMDALWVSGTLHTATRASAMGTSGYRMEAAAVEPYKDRR